MLTDLRQVQVPLPTYVGWHQLEMKFIQHICEWAEITEWAKQLKKHLRGNIGIHLNAENMVFTRKDGNVCLYLGKYWITFVKMNVSS